MKNLARKRAIVALSAGLCALSLCGASVAAAPARADQQAIPGCSTVVPDTVVKIQLSDVRTETFDKRTFRKGVFHIENLGADPIVLASFKKEGEFKIDLPYASIMMWEDGKWTASYFRFGDFDSPPDKLVIAHGATLDFETTIEPMLPAWDPAAQFHLILPVDYHRTCAISAGFTLQPKRVEDARGQRASRKVGAQVCPNKTFDKDVIVKYVKREEYAFGPYVEEGEKQEALTTLEVENRRDTPITLHGMKYGDYFYVPDSVALLQAVSKGGDWVTTSQFVPATVHFPADALSVPAGGKVSILAYLGGGVDGDLIFSKQRVVLADEQGPICAVSDPLPENHGDCDCSGKQ